MNPDTALLAPFTIWDTKLPAKLSTLLMTFANTVAIRIGSVCMNIITLSIPAITFVTVLTTVVQILVAVVITVFHRFCNHVISPCTAFTIVVHMSCPTIINDCPNPSIAALTCSLLKYKYASIAINAVIAIISIPIGFASIAIFNAHCAAVAAYSAMVEATNAAFSATHMTADLSAL